MPELPNTVIYQLRITLRGISPLIYSDYQQKTKRELPVVILEKQPPSTETT